MKAPQAPHKMLSVIRYALLILLALVPSKLFSQSSHGVSYFTISDIGNPRPWRPGEVTAGERIDNVSITARTASGSRARDFDGLVYISQLTDYGPGRTSPEVVQLDDGRWVGSLRIYRAGRKRARFGATGDVWIQVTDQAPNPHFGNSNLFAVRAKRFSRLLVLVPGEEFVPGSITGRVGQPFKQTAGRDFLVRIKATDRYWNAIEDVSHVIRLVSSDTEAVLQSNTRMSDGEVTMTAQLNSAGIQTITAFDVSDPSDITPHTSSNITVDGGTPPTVVRFDFDVIVSPQTVGESVEIRIRAVDQNGNVVSSYNDPATLTASTGPGTFQVGNVVFKNGIWIGTVVLTKADDSVNLTITDSSGDLRNDSNPFELVPGSVARLQVVLPGETETPGFSPGKSGQPDEQLVGHAFPVHVRATDSWWNLTEPGNLAIQFSSSDPQADLPNDTIQSTSQATYSVSLHTDGQNQINVDVDEHPTLTETYVSSRFFVDSGLIEEFVFSEIDSLQIAGRDFPVRIEAHDRSGNIVGNYNDQVILFASTGNGTISKTGVTLTNGYWEGELHVTKADSDVTLFAADFVEPPNTHSGSSNSFVVVPDSLDGFQVLLPGQSATPGVSPGSDGSPEPTLAGDSVRVAIRAVDRFWNLVEETDELLKAEATDRFAVHADSVELVGGSAEMTVVFREAAIQQVSLRSLLNASLPVAVSDEVHVNPNAFSQLVLTLPGESLLPGDDETDPQRSPGRSGEAFSQTSGLSFSVDVFAVDDYFNPISDAPADQVHLFITDNQATISPTDTFLTDGYAQFTVTPVQGGNQVLRAINDSNPEIEESLDSVVEVLVGGLHYEVELAVTSVSAGAPFGVNVFYRNGIGENVVGANHLVRLSAVSADNLSERFTTLENASFNLQAGQRSLNQRIDRAGLVRIKVEDDMGTEPAYSDPLRVAAGSASSLEISANKLEVGGAQSTDVMVTLRDGSGNPVPGQEVQFAVISGSGTLEQTSTVSDTFGVARVAFQGGRTTETNRIRATANSLSVDLEIVVNLTQSDLPDGVVVNYPNPFGLDSESTHLDYYLSEDADVTVKIFDLFGNLVWSQEFAAGTNGGLGRARSAHPNSIEWTGVNDVGQRVGNGSYILVAKALADGKVVMDTRRKIVVLR